MTEKLITNLKKKLNKCNSLWEIKYFFSLFFKWQLFLFVTSIQMQEYKQHPQFNSEWHTTLGVKSNKTSQVTGKVITDNLIHLVSINNFNNC